MAYLELKQGALSTPKLKFLCVS